MMNPKIFAATIVPIDDDRTIADVIAGVLDFIVPIVAGVLMLMVIYGGVQYIMSAGDPDKTAKAKKTLMWAILAVILIVISYGVVVGLNKVVNQEILK
jgi:succinate dehydrogenase hydrophobic anchor subunit